MLGDHTRDTGCGLKAFPREVFLRLPYFDHLHRFLPALVRREGYDILLVDVAHRPRTAGRTKYTNFGRAVVGLHGPAGRLVAAAPAPHRERRPRGFLMRAAMHGAP